MYPDDVNYYYFVARPNGQNLFATTYQEHLANKQQAASERAAMKNG
jgi:cell division protein YceG involved in septum cleavage